jgi:hypothetical protein
VIEETCLSKGFQFYRVCPFFRTGCRRIKK